MLDTYVPQTLLIVMVSTVITFGVILTSQYEVQYRFTSTIIEPGNNVKLWHTLSAREPCTVKHYSGPACSSFEVVMPVRKAAMKLLLAVYLHAKHYR